ncbi:MAG: GyrI-like domain-containing protein [Anaerolineales bacterium]
MVLPAELKVNVIEFPGAQLVVSRATKFPEDLKGCWQRLESKLRSLKGRSFYGLAFTEGDKITYYATLETSDPEEIKALGLPTMLLGSGKYVCVKLLNWSEHTGEIGEIFAFLHSKYMKDSSRPDVEFYRSQAELHLLMPIME